MMHYESKHYAIVADVGGTFARFSRVNLDDLVMDKIEIYPCAEFASLESVLIAYQTKHSLKKIKRVAIAIACPVIDDLICMTNCPWSFSIRNLKEKLGLAELKVINDFSAIAMSLPVLTSSDLIQIGEGHSEKTKVRVVLGAGTGLGVGYLVPNQNGHVAYADAGGHAGWGATTEQEWFIYSYLNKVYGHVSHERILSGQGLENLYKAIAAYHHQEAIPLKAAEIIALALAQQNTIAMETVAQFFTSLGVYAGNLALTLGAFGGVYIAGGIVPRLLPLMQQSKFRSCFEDKGRFRDFNAQIPTYVIIAEQPGILGAAVSLKQSMVGDFDVVS